MLHMFTTYWNGEMMNPIWFSTMTAAALRHNVFFLGVKSRLSAVPFGKWSCHLSCLGQRFLSCHGIGCCCLWENPMSCSSRILWRPDSPAASLKDVAQHARNSGPPRRASQLWFLLSSPLLRKGQIFHLTKSPPGKWSENDERIFFQFKLNRLFWDSFISYIFPKRLRVP